MSRYFTHYWQNSTWQNSQESGAEGDLLSHTAGNLFAKRGVEVGDTVYVITVKGGTLYLCGKMISGKIVDAHKAAKYFGLHAEDLWEASDHIVASAATPKRFDLSVPLTVTAGLRFVSGKKSTILKFVARGQLDQQTLRGVRELEPSSALELDALLQPMEPVSPLGGG